MRVSGVIHSFTKQFASVLGCSARVALRLWIHAERTNVNKDPWWSVLP